VIKRYNNLSFLFGVPGLVLQIAGNVMLGPRPGQGVALLLLLAGTLLLLIGFAYYAMAKGRHPAWCLMAFLSCFGLIVLACLKDKSNEVAGAQPSKFPQRTTHDRPFVIQNPVVGFLNLQGERASALLESDADVLSPLFSECRSSDSGLPRCDVLFLYCDIDASGRVENATDSLRGLVKRARAYIAIVATENNVDAYKKALATQADWNSNLVLVLDRKGPAFAGFFQRLFEKMNSGASMLMVWVKLAPQIPGSDPPDVPGSIMLAEAGHVTFGKAK
jgi:hypothetical protein